jgi:molybdopterin-containing oxidoreductase family membrane subunit
VSQPPWTAQRITDDLVAPCLRPPPAVWWLAVGGAGALASLLFITVAMYCIEGYGIFGPNDTVHWGNDIASYIFWIGIAVAGTLVSSILHLFRQRWRTGINRSTEAMTVFAINIAGIYPLIHTGRPWTDYWLIPHPNTLALMPQFKSPIMWDVFAITGYATASVLFFYYGLLPDFATVRDRATRRWQKLLYGMLAMGWRGTASDWRHYERAYHQFAWIATPLVIGMHSTIATLLAVSHVPGWHATVFPPYFVSGAIFGGLAMALVILIALRRTMKLEAYITVDHLDKLAQIMLGMGMIVLYVYAMEFFCAWWSESPIEQAQFLYRLGGAHAWAFWLMILCNVVLLQLFWSGRLRRNLAVLLLVGLAVNVGMWFERFNIIVLSLEHDHLPSNHTYYRFTGWDYIILAGSFGMFLTQFLLFVRAAPVVSIAEVKVTLLAKPHPAQEQKEGAHG